MGGNGWIKLHRKLLESAVFGNEKALKIWVWCLLRANHKTREVLIGRQKLTIAKGQFIMGSTRAVDELSLAKATIWHWLNFLEKHGQVRLQRTTKYTIVTLLNWEEYQHDLDTDETHAERKVGTNKNEENVKTLGANADVQVVYQEEGEARPRGKPKNTPEMLAGYEIFDDMPARSTWRLMELERESMKTLLQEYGHEELVRRYSIVKTHRGEQYCPLIKSPSTFLQLMPNMELFLARL
jgi:hypothetical protein